MSDFFIDLGQNRNARKLIKALGLPVPMPQRLDRARDPLQERPLADHKIVVGGGATLAVRLGEILTRAGANSFIVGDNSRVVHAFADTGSAYARPASGLSLGDLPETFKPTSIVFDASDLQGPEDLRQLYDLFHPLLGRLATCGRVLVLCPPPEAAKTPAQAAARAAVEGFVRSVAKEIGKRGATAQLLWVEPGADDRLAGPVRFFLSNRSAFITGQPLSINRIAADATPAAWTRSLEGKVALVTGAARGIGAATAKLLADEGAKVVCLDRPGDDGPASKVAREIGGEVLLVDITDSNAPERITRELKERHGGVDIVVHNAGVTRDKTLARMDEERWNQTINVNLRAVVDINEALNPIVNEGGRIICLSSIAGIAGNVGQTNYASSKAGIVGYVAALAPTLAERGITVNAIAPGFIETRLTAAIPLMIREVARRLSTLGQGGEPRDVGDAITFLASPGSQGVSGSVLRVCGGSLVGR